MNRNTPSLTTLDTPPSNLLEMLRMVPVNPTNTDDYDPDDDVLSLAPPLGRAEVLRRLSTLPWLGDYLRSWWPAGSVSPYINNYAALARIATTSAVLRSSHPEDLAYALSLPRSFTYLAAMLLKFAPFASRAKLDTVDASTSPEVIKDLVTEFLMACIYNGFNAMDLLRCVGPSLYPAAHTA